MGVRWGGDPVERAGKRPPRLSGAVRAPHDVPNPPPPDPAVCTCYPGNSGPDPEPPAGDPDCPRHGIDREAFLDGLTDDEAAMNTPISDDDAAGQS